MMRFLYITCSLVVLIFFATPADRAAGQSCPVIEDFEFEKHVIDQNNPRNPHAKTLGDFNGDGKLDAVAASSAGGGIHWYEWPD